MSASRRGSDLETGDKASAGASLDALPAPARPDGHVGRSLQRLRLLRIVLIVFTVCLGGIVVRSILSNRPDRAPVAPGATNPASSTNDAVQTIEKFKFTSTISGKPAYSILADRLTGIAGGIHEVEGIRSIQIMRADGTVLTGRADRGSFVEADSPRGAALAGGTLVLEGHVHIDGSAGERFDSERLEYFQKDGEIASPGPVTFRLPASQGPRSSTGSTVAGRGADGPLVLIGSAGRLEYEMSSHKLKLAGGLDLTIEEPGAPGTRVRAASAHADAGTGQASFEGQVTVERGRDGLSAPSVRIERFPTGGQRLVAGPGAHARLEDMDSPGDRSAVRLPDVPERPKALLASAETIELTEPPGARGRIVRLDGAARIEEERVAGDPAGRTIQAQTIVVEDPGGAEERRLDAEGNVLVLFPPGPGEPAPRRLTARTLAAVSVPGGALSRADASGGVTFRAGHRVATAERATFLDETHVQLRGMRPRLEEPDRVMVGDEIDLLFEPSRVEGRGSVRTRFVPRDGSTSGPFEPGEAVDIASGQATLTEQPSRAEFQGTVVARQGERALTAARLVLDDAKKTVTGEGGVSLRAFREDAPSTAPAVRVPVRIDGDSFLHDTATGSTRFEGHGVYREPGRTLFADCITTARSQSEAGTREPSEVTAEGHVIIEGDGKRGMADFARYRSDQRSVTLEGRQRQAELVDTTTRRTWRGPALTWVLTPDSIPVVTGDSGRSRIVGSATGPGQDRVGKNADRQRSR